MRLAERSHAVRHRVVHPEVRVDHHGHNQLPVELQIDLKLHSIALEKFRAADRPSHACSCGCRSPGVQQGKSSAVNAITPIQWWRDRQGSEWSGRLPRYEAVHCRFVPMKFRARFLPCRIGKALDRKEMTLAEVVDVLGPVTRM